MSVAESFQAVADSDEQGKINLGNFALALEKERLAFRIQEGLQAVEHHKIRSQAALRLEEIHAAKVKNMYDFMSDANKLNAVVETTKLGLAGEIARGSVDSADFANKQYSQQKLAEQAAKATKDRGNSLQQAHSQVDAVLGETRDSELAPGQPPAAGGLSLNGQAYRAPGISLRTDNPGKVITNPNDIKSSPGSGGKRITVREVGKLPAGPLPAGTSVMLPAKPSAPPAVSKEEKK